MEKNKFEKYFSILKELYKNRNINIEWYKNHYKFNAKIDLEDYFLEKGEQYSKAEFDKFLRGFVTLIKDISVDNIKQTEEWKKDLILNENFFTKEEMDHIAIITTSKLPTLESIESEILTKRSSININKTNSYSVLLSINIINSIKSDIYIELSKKQLKEIIDNLSEIYSDMEGLETTERGLQNDNQR